MSGLVSWFKQLKAPAVTPVITGPASPQANSIYAKIFSIAKAEVGVKEISGSKDTPRIQEYFRSTHYEPSGGGAIHDETPWCAAFVGWVLNQAGLVGTHSAGASSYDKWGVQLAIPVQGCVACVEHLDEHGKKNGRRHVTFFDRFSSDPNYVYLLGGNQGNEVCSKKYHKNEVNSFRGPK